MKRTPWRTGWAPALVNRRRDLNWHLWRHLPRGSYTPPGSIQVAGTVVSRCRPGRLFWDPSEPLRREPRGGWGNACGSCLRLLRWEERRGRKPPKGARA